MAYYLFVSYARDDREAVDRIVGCLKWQGYSIWIDRDAIRFGEWSKQIDDALSACRAMLVLLSPSSVSSQWVQREVATASSLNKLVVPVSLAESAIPDQFKNVFGHIQFIAHGGDAAKCATLIEATLTEFGISPQLLDESDPDLLEARRLIDTGDQTQALELYERIIESRPLHLVAVMDAVASYYNAGRARILREENQGIRPHGLNEMVPEFWAAERIVTRYINKDTGEYDRLFKADLWKTLGTLASFVGMYDDAFNRLSAAQNANPENPKVQQLLDQLRSSLARPIGPALLPFPEANDFSTWHAIVFPFTVEITRTLQVNFPEWISDDWRRLWLINHNIGQLERLDTGENAVRELTHSCEYLGELSDLWFADLGARRIVGAIVGGQKQPGKKTIAGLLPTGQSSAKSAVADAFRGALDKLPSTCRSQVAGIWNSRIDDREYVMK